MKATIINFEEEKAKRRFTPKNRRDKRQQFSKAQVDEIRRTLDKAIQGGAIVSTIGAIHDSGITAPGDILDTLCEFLFDLSYGEVINYYRMTRDE